MVQCAGTIDYVASQHSFDFSISDINLFLGDEVMKSTSDFSISDINLFLGDEVMKSSSEISETNFTCEDNAVTGVTKGNEPHEMVSNLQKKVVLPRCWLEVTEVKLKSNSMIEDQSSQFTELAVDGGTAAAEDATEMWRPNSESVEVKNFDLVWY
ncbi:unnamed protein product [Camellia sinensis]